METVKVGQIGDIDLHVVPNGYENPQIIILYWPCITCGNIHEAWIQTGDCPHSIDRRTSCKLTMKEEPT